MERAARETLVWNPLLLMVRRTLIRTMKLIEVRWRRVDGVGCSVMCCSFSVLAFGGVVCPILRLSFSTWAFGGFACLCFGGLSPYWFPVGWGWSWLLVMVWLVWVLGLLGDFSPYVPWLWIVLREVVVFWLSPWLSLFGWEWSMLFLLWWEEALGAYVRPLWFSSSCLPGSRSGCVLVAFWLVGCWMGLSLILFGAIGWIGGS